MLEDENPVPPTVISDPALATDMAYGEKPYRELEAHAKELGVEHVAKQMDIQATEAAKAIVEGYIPDPANSTEVQTSETAAVIEAPSAEKKISPERLSEMIRDSAVGTHAWMSAREIPADKKDGTSSETTVGTSKKIRELTDETLGRSVGLLKQFEAHSVSEVITIQEMGGSMKFAKPDTTKPDEPVVMVGYQTTNRRQLYEEVKYPQPMARGGAGTGNSMLTCLFMPKSAAVELVNAMQTDPAIIREAVDVAMRQEVEASTTWDQMKPPYDKWREINGGVDRIALRNSFEADTNQAQILEF